MNAIHAAVILAHQQVMTCFRQCDAAGVAAVYADEGQIMPAYSTAIHGRAAIQAFWQGCIDMGIGALQRQTLTVDCLTDTLNETGEYAFFDRAGRLIDVGKYVIIWKVQHGRWKIQHDIWTSNRSPEQASMPNPTHHR